MQRGRVYAQFMQTPLQHDEPRACPAHACPTLARSLDYARDHLARRIPLQTLADLAGLSTWRFSIVFRRHMGVPPHRYISQLRIARARELLWQGVPAASVADACGFYDQSHFSRHFKQHCGMTPGQYALQHREMPAATADFPGGAHALHPTT